MSKSKTEILAKLFLSDPVAHYSALLIGHEGTSYELKAAVWAQMSEERRELMRPYLKYVKEERS